MDFGFVGLGNMGFPMTSRLVAAGHRVAVFDTNPAPVERAVALGADAAVSVRDVGDRTETVLASLPTPQVSNDLAAELAQGASVERFVDRLTVGEQAAQRNAMCCRDGRSRARQPGQRGRAWRASGHSRGHGVRPAE